MPGADSSSRCIFNMPSSSRGDCTNCVWGSGSCLFLLTAGSCVEPRWRTTPPVDMLSLGSTRPDEPFKNLTLNPAVLTRTLCHTGLREDVWAMTRGQLASRLPPHTGQSHVGSWHSSRVTSRSPHCGRAAVCKHTLTYEFLTADILNMTTSSLIDLLTVCWRFWCSNDYI